MCTPLALFVYARARPFIYSYIPETDFRKTRPAAAAAARGGNEIGIYCTPISTLYFKRTKTVSTTYMCRSLSVLSFAYIFKKQYVCVSSIKITEKKIM